MSISDQFFQHWYFHIPNLVLAALIYTMIGAFILGLLFGKDSNAVIVRVFANITDPIARVVRTITPAIVPNGLVLVFSIVWLMALRMFWFITCIAWFGMRPSVMGG
jgi:uncharacterized protein YggT (Ycf19 family)